MARSNSATLWALVMVLLLATAVVTASRPAADVIDPPCDARYEPFLLRARCGDTSGWWAPVPDGDCCSALVDAGIKCVCNTLLTELVDHKTIKNYLTRCSFPPGSQCKDE